MQLETLANHLEGASGKKQRATAHGQTLLSERLANVLFGLLDSVSQESERLAEKVERDRGVLLDQGLSETQAAMKLSRRYADAAVLRSSFLNGLSAVPFVIPGVGPITTFVGTVGAAIYYTYKTEIELTYLVAYANRTPIRSQELKHTVYWILQLRDFESMKRQANSMGLRITLSTVLQKLVGLSLSRGLGHVCELLKARGYQVVDPVVGRQVSWVIGTPLSTWIGYRSTRGVANRARDFFENQRSKS